VKSTAVLYREN